MSGVVAGRRVFEGVELITIDMLELIASPLLGHFQFHLQ
jgi:hypothetical protein